METKIPLEKARNRILKRTEDFLICFLASLILFPLFILVCLLIKFTSHGPIFLRQERLGLKGRHFYMYKFRSMIQDAEKTNRPVWSRDKDPRTTAVGRFLRKRALDEFAQIINILKGEMSVVGPRPERLYFVEVFQSKYPKYQLRHRAKPGVTGWAQINGWRRNTSLIERIKYDNFYIEHWSIWLDIKIIALSTIKTIKGRWE